MKTRWLIILFALLALPVGSWAREYTPSEVPNVQLQDSRRFVSDPEGYFSPEDRVALDDALYQLREKHTVEVVLVVLPGIENDDPESFAVKLFELWGIGKREDNNGLLILYKFGRKGERIIRLETGYGLEGALPDITTKRLTNRYLLPAISEGRDAEGFLQMIGAIDELLTEGYEARNDGNRQYGYEEEQQEALGGLLWGYIGFSLLVGLLFGGGLWTRWRRLKEPALRSSLLSQNFSLPKQMWQWLIFPALILLLPLYWILRGRTRRQLHNCPQCHTKGSVRAIVSPENLSLLSAAQATEQRLHSVNYTLYQCSACSYHRAVGVSNSLSGYQRCPRCGTKSYKLLSQQERSNMVVRRYHCEYCDYDNKDVIRFSNPRRGGVGPIVGGGFGGGFGGGGSFGGGFGGGSSGGGGSTTRF